MPVWTIRQSNEQYDIWDCDLGGMVVSVTSLHSGQHTNGHSHDYTEWYRVIEGNGILKYGRGSTLILAPYCDWVKIPKGSHHQAFNDSDKEFIFLCVWRKE